MRQIWKFPLEVKKEQEVTLPFGSKILSVGEQFGDIFLWVSVKIDYINTDQKSYTVANKRILIFGTGHELPQNIHEYEFLGTVITDGGNFVWHIFDGGFVSLALDIVSGIGSKHNTQSEN